LAAQPRADVRRAPHPHSPESASLHAAGLAAAEVAPCGNLICHNGRIIVFNLQFTIMATDTDAWLIHADNYELPQEQIPLLKKGEATGETYGWPKGMLGPESTSRLHQKGIHTTSTLIRIAQQLKHEEFRKVFGGKDNVWPNRYEAAHGYLTRVINNAENAVEDHKRCGIDRAAASDIGAGNTQAWAVFADTRQLPEEDIPLLTKTQSGQDFGWPSGLMGPVSTSRLHAKGITRTSQLIQSANRLDHEQFKQ
jgi:hypothetical protein